MFEDFANVWTVVGMARDVGPADMLPVRIAGEAVVLFRGQDGQIAALLDRCPHRGVALSLGTLRNGQIICPFHGWRFDATGRNCHVPWNPDAKRDLLGATTLPVRESGGLIWLYTGFEPKGEPEPSEILMRSDLALCGQSVTWSIHWTRVMENMLDSPHLPFVHAGTIGRGLKPLIDRRMDLSWTETPYGATIMSQVDVPRPPARLDYRFPNAMELFIDPPKRTLRMLAICLPVDRERTRLTIYTLRSFARARLFDRAFAWLNARIAREDQAVLETSFPAEVPPAGQERSVRTDAPTLAFRKIYFEQLKGSRAVQSAGDLDSSK
jgi:phenylpropionate dioxygenase-like ring-hydroxylating dioxygenase large terminal subunit